ncbi:MAG: AAA family ATPase [Holosporaceae bacterium]|jgi:putative DNA primase/helicase|nr:AAA family ATPase [Holosporaceae bacterium]
MKDNAERASNGSRLIVYNVEDFLSLDLPPRELIVDPIIPTQGVTMLYSKRGVGKTFVALTIAVGTAAGTNVFNWKIPKPRKVLYVDGEMSPQTMQERHKGIIKGVGKDFPSDNLKIYCAAIQDSCFLNLSDEKDQKALEFILDGVDLLILDNLSTLTEVKENDADSWLSIQKWLIRLRQKNVSVLLIHHAGKSGQQRGTSRKEDILDCVVTLKSSREDDAQGAEFEVQYEKCRGFVGVKPFKAKLISDEEGKFTWSVSEYDLTKKIKEMLDFGMTQRDIASELGISQSRVCRLKNGAVRDR